MDEIAKEQEEIEQGNAFYEAERLYNEHKDECNGCALCEL